MRTIYAIIIIVSLFVVSCAQEDLGVWTSNEITVTMDSSLQDLGEGSSEIIEDAILTWLDHVDRDITVNFVYEDCSVSPKNTDVAAENCVMAVDELNSDSTGNPVLASAFLQWSGSDNSITNGDILFNRSFDWKVYKLHSVALHEAGHFWGITTHSDNSDDIMHASSGVFEDADLTDNDVKLIQDLYN